MSHDFNQQQPPQAYGSPPPAPRSSGMKIVWILLGAFGVLGLVCCGGCAFFGFWGMNKGAELIAQALSDAPAVKEHIGEIESASINYTATAEYKEQYPDAENLVVVDVKGSKGSGQLIVNTSQGGGPEGIRWARLRLDSGEEFLLGDSRLNPDPDRRF